MPAEASGGPSPRDLLSAAQKLVDAKPADGEHPLEWAVPAHFLGDMTALAAASLRAPH